MPEPTHEPGCPPPPRDPFGTPIRVFRSTWRNRAVVAACGTAMLACGLFLSFYPPGRTRVGPLLAGWSGPVLVLAALLGKHRLLVCPGGVVRRRYGFRGWREESCRWDEAGEVVSTRTRVGLTTSRYVSLVRRDGARIVVTDLQVAEYDALVALLRPVAESHGVRWTEETAAR